MRYRETPPLPVVVARRRIALPLGRTLDVVAVESLGGHLDCWLRCRSSAGFVVGQFHVPPSALRELAETIAGLAGELGCAPGVGGRIKT